MASDRGSYRPLLSKSTFSIDASKEPDINVYPTTWTVCGWEIDDKLSFVGIVTSILFGLSSMIVGAIGLTMAIQNNDDINRLDRDCSAFTQ